MTKTVTKSVRIDKSLERQVTQFSEERQLSESDAIRQLLRAGLATDAERSESPPLSGEVLRDLEELPGRITALVTTIQEVFDELGEMSEALSRVESNIKTNRRIARKHVSTLDEVVAVLDAVPQEPVYREKRDPDIDPADRTALSGTVDHIKAVSDINEQRVDVILNRLSTISLVKEETSRGHKRYHIPCILTV